MGAAEAKGKKSRQSRSCAQKLKLLQLGQVVGDRCNAVSKLVVRQIQAPQLEKVFVNIIVLYQFTNQSAP
jgi:uncharacterized membrane protein